MRRRISDWLLRQRAEQLSKPREQRPLSFVWHLVTKTIEAVRRRGGKAGGTLPL